MSSTGIDKVLILRNEPGISRILEEFVMHSLKHPHEIKWGSLQEEGIRLARKGDYGLLIISSRLEDTLAVKICQVAVGFPTASVIFLDEIDSASKEDARKGKERLLELGATVLSRPIKQSAFATAVQAADMAHIRLCTLKKKMDDEKLITRGKLLLMQTLGLSEDEAHKHIEKEAMNTGKTRTEVAMKIIRTYEE